MGGVEILPVSGHHSERFTVTGYRIGRLAYLTDFKTIEDAEGEKPGCGGAGGQCAALCRALLHFNVAEALELIRRVGPREAWLTHMSHDIGLQAEMEPTTSCTHDGALCIPAIHG